MSDQVSHSERYKFGRDILAPIFAAFSYLLLQEARAKNLKKLGFVARDGELLKTACIAMAEAMCWPQPPSFHYLYLSRRSIALPWLGGVNARSYAEAKSATGRHFNLDVFLNFLGLNVEPLLPQIARNGLDRFSPLNEFAQLAPLLTDPEFNWIVEQEREDRTRTLRGYLKQAGFFDTPGSALVDIGWRASLQVGLTELFAEDSTYRAPMGLYLGYWHENGVLVSPSCRVTGLLADYSRSRSLLEGAAYYLSLPLEAICRATHGTVLGYRNLSSDNSFIPVLASSREHECIEASEWLEPVHTGLTDGLVVVGQHWRTHPPEANSLRRKTQWKMLRLAFFPSAKEVATLGKLRHTEGHLPGWSRPLIEIGQRPWQNVRQWIGGMDSPWRSGYIAASGGKFFATSFLLLETLLSALPLSAKKHLRKFAEYISKDAN